MINRARLRGEPLDVDCKKAETTRHEYGPDDERVFCYALYNCTNLETIDKTGIAGHIFVRRRITKR